MLRPAEEGTNCLLLAIGFLEKAEKYIQTSTLDSRKQIEYIIEQEAALQNS